MSVRKRPLGRYRRVTAPHTVRGVSLINQSGGLPADRVAQLRRLFSRFAAVVITLVGVVALIIGSVLLASQRWPAADATVQSCTSHLSRSSGTSTHRTAQVQWDCQVTWVDSAGSHTDTLDYGGKHAVPGEVDRIRVHGNVIVLENPVWVPYVVLGVGLVLLVVGVFLFVRTVRRPPRELVTTG